MDFQSLINEYKKQLAVLVNSGRSSEYEAQGLWSNFEQHLIPLQRKAGELSRDCERFRLQLQAYQNEDTETEDGEE